MNDINTKPFPPTYAEARQQEERAKQELNRANAARSAAKRRGPRRVPIHDTDRDGEAIVLVPLANSTKVAKILLEDFRALTAAGVTDQWTVNGKGLYPYVRCGVGTGVTGRLETVARLLMKAKPGQVVRNKDGDVFNLRRDNLTWRKGKSTRGTTLQMIAEAIAAAKAAHAAKKPSVRFLQKALNALAEPATGDTQG